MLDVSVKCVQMLVGLEALKLRAYRDSGGALTIGVGHLLTELELRTGMIWIGDEFVEWKGGLTKEQAIELKREDLKLAHAGVRRYVVRGLRQCEVDALTSFVFNVGSGQWKTSTLLKRVNAGAVATVGEIREAWRRWKKDRGKVVQGLINRREIEIAMYEGRWRPGLTAKVARLEAGD